MAWIESHQDIGQHPKTVALATALNGDLPQAVGVLHLLWHFTLKFAWRTGDLKKYPIEAIASAVGWRGDPHLLISGLQKSGWLNKMKVHDWMDYAGRIVHDRLYNEKRRKTPTNAVPRRKTGATLPDPTLPNPTEPKSCAQKALPYQRPNPDKNPVSHVVMAYKLAKGYPFDDRIFDKKWARWMGPAKQLMEDCGGVEAAEKFIRRFAELRKDGKLSWTLETVADKAHELKVTRRDYGANAIRNSEGIPDQDIKSRAEGGHSQAGSFVSADKVLGGFGYKKIP